ncbi:Con-6 family protein [Aspergillus foveolatus]|uniref:Con-6 family protein n=1 Tax=Aspergillus foveolatus TaxID=210207 RepID=UPI003CCDD87A
MSPHEIPRTRNPEERINAARGFRAALHNPHVSETAKEHARQSLQDLDEDEARREMQEEAGQHVPYHRQHRRYETRHASTDQPMPPQERINAARGYKAALHNPLVSEKGKEHARRMLLEMDDQEAREELYREKPKSPTRVAAGLKAVTHNRRLSDSTRYTAAQKLRDMGYDQEEEQR